MSEKSKSSAIFDHTQKKKIKHTQNTLRTKRNKIPANLKNKKKRRNQDCHNVLSLNNLHSNFFNILNFYFPSTLYLFFFFLILPYLK